MSIVTLVSGGLDSTVMSLLIQEQGITQFPLIINYGQLNFAKESSACFTNFEKHSLPKPECLAIENFGRLIPSGITDNTMDVRDAFLPCRNLLFLTCAASYAYKNHATAIAIGLLSEEFSIYPDQSKTFITATEKLISQALGQSFKILTPLMSFCKAEVLKLAKSKNIMQTYSCHAGTEEPCGKCIACCEFKGLEV